MSTLVFYGVRVAHIFSFVCCVFLLFACLSSYWTYKTQDEDKQVYTYNIGHTRHRIKTNKYTHTTCMSNVVCVYLFVFILCLVCPMLYVYTCLSSSCVLYVQCCMCILVCLHPVSCIICCGECFLVMVMDFALSNMFSFFWLLIFQQKRIFMRCYLSECLFTL
jgi:hypothetical protein